MSLPNRRQRLQAWVLDLLANGGAIRILASLLSGVALVFISAPANIAWMHWFSFVPMLWALRPGENRKNGVIAWMGGWLAIFILYFWLIETIIRFSNVPWVLAFAAHLLFTTLFSLPYLVLGRLVHWFRDRFGWAWTLAVPLLWVSMEMVPSLFPYYHGVSQYRNPYTWQLASVFGVTSLTFLVWWCNAVLVEFVYQKQAGGPLPWRSFAAVGLSLVGTVTFGVWRHGDIEATLAEAPVLRTAILQQNVSMEQRLHEDAATTLVAWVETTRAVLPDHPDLVIWPEGALPFNPDDTRKARFLGNLSPKEFFSAWTIKHNFHLLIGGGTWEPTELPDGSHTVISYNSAYAYNRKGELIGRYDKMIPLPFGEYIPGAEWFPWLANQIQGVGNFRAGEAPTVFHGETADGFPYSYSVPICYEAILTTPMWWLYEGTEDKPVDLFVVITNDAWFGDTASPHQHAMLTTVQAMQFGRPMVRLAYTGVSWVVEPHGDIRGETEPFTDVTRIEPVRMATIPTIYVAGGWVFPWLCIGACGTLLVVGRRRAVA